MVQMRFDKHAYGQDTDIRWPDAITVCTNLTRLTVERFKDLPANIGNLVSMATSSIVPCS
jgi:hypothetical protein